jgi:hypothetical protein
MAIFRYLSFFFPFLSSHLAPNPISINKIHRTETIRCLIIYFLVKLLAFCGSHAPESACTNQTRALGSKFFCSNVSSKPSMTGILLTIHTRDIIHNHGGSSRKRRAPITRLQAREEAGLLVSSSSLAVSFV